MWFSDVFCLFNLQHCGSNLFVFARLFIVNNYAAHYELIEYRNVDFLLYILMLYLRCGISCQATMAAFKTYTFMLLGLLLAVYLNYPAPSNMSNNLIVWKTKAAKAIIFNKNKIFYKGKYIVIFLFKFFRYRFQHKNDNHDRCRINSKC